MSSGQYAKTWKETKLIKFFLMFRGPHVLTETLKDFMVEGSLPYDPMP